MIKIRLNFSYTGRIPPCYLYSSNKIKRRLKRIDTISYRIKCRHDFMGWLFNGYPLVTPRFKKRAKRKIDPSLVSPRFIQKRIMRCVCDLCKQEREHNASCPYDFTPNIRMDFEYTDRTDLTFYNDNDFMMFVFMAPPGSYEILQNV